MKSQYVNTIRAGERVDDLFVLSRKTMGQKRDGSNYLTITLTDKTGSIKGVVWDNVDRIAARVNSGDFVRASGSISEYRDDLQFVVKALEPSPARDLDPTDFIPATRHDINRMWDQLQKLTGSMQDPGMTGILFRTSRRRRRPKKCTMPLWAAFWSTRCLWPFWPIRSPATTAMSIGMC